MRQRVFLIFAIAFVLPFSVSAPVAAQDAVLDEMNSAESAAGVAPLPEPKSDANPGELSSGNQNVPPPEMHGPGKFPPAQEIPPPETKAAEATESPPAKTPPAEEVRPTTVESNSEVPVEQEEGVQTGESVRKEDGGEGGTTAVTFQGGGNGSATVEGNKVCKCRFDAETSYSARRSSIGGFLAFQGGSYSPDNYQPDFNNKTFNKYYTDKKTPNLELVFGMKYNFSLGSIGPQISAGYFGAQNLVDGAKFSVIPITAGVIFALDNLFSEPYVVPYVSGGEYTAYYNESVGGQTVKGNTAFSQFYALGLMFQLDWMDRETHDSAYEDFGLENVFIYVEGRSFLPSKDIADLSTPLQLSGGLKVEF